MGWQNNFQENFDYHHKFGFIIVNVSLQPKVGLVFSPKYDKEICIQG